MWRVLLSVERSVAIYTECFNIYGFHVFFLVFSRFSPKTFFIFWIFCVFHFFIFFFSFIFHKLFLRNFENFTFYSLEPGIPEILLLFFFNAKQWLLILIVSLFVFENCFLIYCVVVFGLFYIPTKQTKATCPDESQSFRRNMLNLLCGGL